MAATTTSVVSSSSIAYVGSGSQIAAAGIMVSSDISTALVGSTNLGKYPRCDLVLTFSPTASVASTSTSINVYRRDVNVDGAADDPLPLTNATSTYKQKYVGTFVVRNNTASSAETTSYTLIDVPLPGTADCEFYIENALAVNIPAGWKLTVIPKSDAAA